MRPRRENEELLVALYAIITESISFISLFIQCVRIIRRRNEGRERRRRGFRRPYLLLPAIPRQIEHLNNMVGVDDISCVNNLRMSRNAFGRLCEILEGTGRLSTTRYVSVPEQVAMFLLILSHHTKNRIVSHNFMRSGRTVSHHFHKVLNAVISLHPSLYAKPVPVAEGCADDRWAIFKGCLGALDGTHIKINVPLSDKPRYRNRKGEVSVNVLGVCDRNMNFVYVLTGWEGSAADSRVLRDAVSRTNGIRVPRGCFYLCDCGYANADGFLTPYKGSRYHLQDFADGAVAPRTREELFNLRHAKARNVIERTFGLLKGRWAILRSASYYPPRIHNKIVIACCLLHNYIRREMPVDPLEGVGLEEVDRCEHQGQGDIIDMVEPSGQWNSLRDTLANTLWQIYRR